MKTASNILMPYRLIVAGVFAFYSCSELLSSEDEECESVCDGNNMIIGCDNRVVKPEAVDGTTEQPWNFIGRFDGGSQCSGTLIAGKFVLTAAHCMFDQGDEVLGFALAQEFEAGNGRPYGTVGVKRIFVPAEFQGNNIEEQAALDYAVVELTQTPGRVTPANWGYVEWDILRTRPVFTAGYPFVQPDGGILGRPWITGDSGGKYFEDQPYESIDNGESGLLYTDLDGTGGQSGSGVYSFLLPSQHDGDGIIRKVNGVLIGSTVTACDMTQMWVVNLTPGAVEHIENAMDPGVIDFFWRIIEIPVSPTSGPGEDWP